MLVKNKICYFSFTSGTTGVRKKIPATSHTFGPFCRGGSIFIWNLKQEIKKQKRGIFSGEILNLTETWTEPTPSGIPLGVISGFATSRAKDIMSVFMCLPKEAIGVGKETDMRYIKARYALQQKDLLCINSVFMSTIIDWMTYIKENYEMLLKDIETGTINQNIVLPTDVRRKLEKKLKPNPERAKELREIFEKQIDESLIAHIWKKLALIVAIGTGEFEIYEEKLRKYCGDKIAISYSMIASSEATISTTLEPERKDSFLLFDGCFFEFKDIETNQLLLMHQLTVGRYYELIVTNYSGLYRYQLRDVLKVMGYCGKVPMVQFGYRQNQLINIGGLHLNQENMVEIIKNYEKDLNTNILDYSLYLDYNHSPSRMILFIETEKNLQEKSPEELGKKFERLTKDFL